MKHASVAPLELLNGMLAELRVLPGLVEKKSGTFYLKGSAFLHFHEDPLGMFADIKLDGVKFKRFPVNTATQRSKVVKEAKTFLLAAVATRADPGRAK
jgi:hypothetical protein